MRSLRRWFEHASRAARNAMISPIGARCMGFIIEGARRIAGTKSDAAVQVGATCTASTTALAAASPGIPPHGVAVAGPAVDVAGEVAVGVMFPANARELLAANEAPRMIAAAVIASAPMVIDLFKFSLL